MNELFEKNIKFFYQNLPHYYELIKNIKTRNFLIKENNLIDKNGNKLYPSSIEEDSKKFAFYPTHNDLWEKRFFYLHPIKWERKFFITGKIVNKLIKKAKTLKEYTHNGFYFDKDFLPTTAIFGLLAGKHLDILVDNFEFQSLFVYEPNPEFFAISLYFVDYPKIYKKLQDRFFLWVNGTLDYFAIEKFYYERKITSSFMNLTLTTYDHPLIKDAKNKFEEIRNAKLRGWGTYEDEIKGVKNHLENLNKYPLLSKKENLNIPFCIVANGKSLEQNIDFIKKNRESMIIISVGTAIKPLLKAGIESDFHIEQERIDILKDVLKDILPNYNGYFVGANVVNPEVFKMAKHPLMYTREAFSLSEHHILTGSSPIVGNAGFAFAANFTKEIYLCGMDLGFRIGDKKHSKNSFYDKTDDIAKDGIKIKGNFSDDIYTDSLLLTSKYNIEKMIKNLNLKVYNLSDGAYIEGSTPLKDKTLPKIEKEKYKKIILQCFTTTHLKIKPLNLTQILKPVKNTLNKKVKNYKELTGLIDFIDDAVDTMHRYYPREHTLLRGSISHILNNFYILSHKIDSKDIPKLAHIIQKEIFLFQKDFEKKFNKFFKE
ncbi:MAG: 6-hydroxymethylpterin diphosphokinase MptE-like protein [Nautiliaceae bacterium]